MGYVVKKLPGNNKRSWKLQFQTEIGGKRKIRDVSEAEFNAIGFSQKMSRTEAEERRDQINAQAHLKFQEQRRNAIHARLKDEATVQAAYLPEALVKEFEDKHLFARMDKAIAKRNKTGSHWRGAKRVLCDLKVDISDWAVDCAKFYDYFSEEAWSYSYVQKLIAMLNRWGAFQARTFRQYYEPLPNPTGIERQRIEDSYFDNNEGGQTSDPLTPEQLISKHSRLEPLHHNWLFLSVWFGLRPAEVDLLKEPSSRTTWYIDKDGQGTTILRVYQTKLKSIARDKRWKGIPVLYPEQFAALDILTSQEFERPLAKTVRNHFGPKTTCYAGRKGFTKLMEDRDQDLVNISLWLGHTTVDRTIRSYRDRNEVKYRIPG